MTDPMDTRRSGPESRIFGSGGQTIPALLVAWAPEGTVDQELAVVTAPFTVGRTPDNDLTISDDKVSKQHLRISHGQQGFFIHDLQSTNGVFVDGVRVGRKMALSSPAILRVGRAVLVFHADAAALLEPPGGPAFGMAGRFHTGPILLQLREAALSGRHVLVTGPSGTGKELAAQALAAMRGPTPDEPLPLHCHNAARFASEEEATSTLFGVAARVFSNVDARPGLLEQAHKGVLFLDEVHNLPERVQRSLLRVLEDGQVARIGETRSRPVEVQLMLASNVPGPGFGLAHDLLARLRVVRIPALRERAADVPRIFDAVVEAALQRFDLDKNKVFPLFSGDHYEAICLDGFESDNVRGLVDLADRLATRLAAGASAERAVTSIFQERFAGGPVADRDDEDPESSARSHYEQHRSAITAAFKKSKGNLSATERLLRSQGIRCSRRWLASFAHKWGLR